jgi:hypothetical protein
MQRPAVDGRRPQVVIPSHPLDLPTPVSRTRSGSGAPQTSSMCPASAFTLPRGMATNPKSSSAAARAAAARTADRTADAGESRRNPREFEPGPSMHSVHPLDPPVAKVLASLGAHPETVWGPDSTPDPAAAAAATPPPPPPLDPPVAKFLASLGVHSGRPDPIPFLFLWGPTPAAAAAAAAEGEHQLMRELERAWSGLTDNARYVILHFVDPRYLCKMKSHDVASIICEAVARGRRWRSRRPGRGRRRGWRSPPRRRWVSWTAAREARWARMGRASQIMLMLATLCDTV